jgi:hypothetical protein
VRVLISFLLCAAALAAQAHRQHHVWTEIERNPNSGLVEISHRLHMQDAISVLQLAGKDKATLPIESVEALAEIALYVDRRFAVSPRCQNTKIQSLELVGAGIDDDFIYVFQEMQLSGQLHELVFTSSLLQDIEPYAASFVNLLTPAGQFTYQFAQESPNEQPEVIHCVNTQSTH